jgi:hypothetical protein
VSTRDDAVKALETAVEKVDAFVADPEENDVSEPNKLMRQLALLLPNYGRPTAGESVDALSGQPMPQNFDGPGPDSPPKGAPETSKPEDDAPPRASESEGGQLTDRRKD